MQVAQEFILYLVTSACGGYRKIVEASRVLSFADTVVLLKNVSLSLLTDRTRSLFLCPTGRDEEAQDFIVCPMTELY